MREQLRHIDATGLVDLARHNDDVLDHQPRNGVMVLKTWHETRVVIHQLKDGALQFTCTPVPTLDDPNPDTYEVVFPANMPYETLTRLMEEL